MSILQNEIRALLRDIVPGDEGRVTATIAFPADFTGFKGHFPGQPILPGVCKVLTVLVLLEEAVRGPVRLASIVLAKFLAPVAAGDRLRIALQLERSAETEGGVKAQFFADEKKVAEIHLEVRYE